MTTESPSRVQASPRYSWIQLSTSAVLLALTFILGLRVMRQASPMQRLLTPESIASFADAAERDRRFRDTIGTFSTGDAAGDRGIEIKSDGTVRFYLIGPLQSALEYRDQTRAGQRAGHTALITRSSGTIDALDIDRLSYFDDVYQRVVPSAP